MEYSENVDFSKNINSFVINKNYPSNCLIKNIENKYCLLTICITVYKRVDTLKKALDSVLNQKTDFLYNIIVLDDCDNYEGENPVLKLIESYKVNNIAYYQNSKNLGMAGTWNRCGELAGTPYFAILHDDDLLKDNYVQEICSFIKKHKNIDCIVNNFEVIDFPYGNNNTINKKKIITMINSLKKKVVKQKSLSCNLFLDNYYGPPTCGICFKKSSFITSGGFYQQYYPALDWYFMVYFGLKNNVVRLRKNLSCYVWAQNESLKQETQEAFKIQRKILIKNITRNYFISRLINILLKKDFEKKENTYLTEVLKTSKLYKIFYEIYSFKYGH